MKITFFSLFLLLSGYAQGFVILIDPGHGGKELGAVSYIVEKVKGKKVTKKLYEKDLCLQLAKLLKEKLSEHFTVYLTRSFDNTVSLQQRADLADTVKADLFISIHFNASHVRNSHGFETFYLGNHKDRAVQKVEKIENQELEGDDKVINQILIDLAIKKTAKASKQVAKAVHKRIKSRVEKRFSIKDRGVKPSLFYVLALSKRPGLLLEAGFMSNPREVFQIKSSKYMEVYAEAVVDGVRDFYESRPKKKVPLF